MDISGNRFSGEIPFSVGSCTSLENLSVNGNSFIGNIPPSLSSLKSIKMLDLSSNNLSGQIPEYLENLSFLGFLNLPYNHFEGEVPTKGVFILLLSSVCFIIVIKRRRKPAQESSSMSNLEGQFPMISYAELSKATNGFSSSKMIGQGNLGLVYKGMLNEDLMLVAVKVINLHQKGASKSFMAECEALRNVCNRDVLLKHRF
ncbi:hypothetical protein LWI28_024606 [Acer negundo]|uniref:Protein kinase domain-containing protein n=1 Tax=Acer negundo TaxID=4023 RepID=A0AAD5JEJ5_ACENE|nr:hypothetical protein LWI28_024606 [Acer negundo]